MKTRIFLLIGILLLSVSIASSNEAVTGTNPSQDGSIQVYTTPDLFNLTTKWAIEYGKLNPAMNIQVIQSEDKDLPGLLGSDAGIGFISDGSFAASDKQVNWNMVIGRDVIVPVMNAENPLADEIGRKGITAEGLARIFGKPENQNWGMILGNAQTSPVHAYMLNDASVQAGVSAFLNISQLKTAGIQEAGGAEMVAAIQKDPNALGFCKLVDIIDPKNLRLAEHIKLVPIDRNGNGKIDYMENIYADLESFSRGVWIGKYPHTLSGHIYAVSSARPSNEQEVAFLRWALTDGQQFLGQYGFSDLVYNERQTQLDKLTNSAVIIEPKTDSFAIAKMVLLIFLALAVVGIIVSTVARNIRNKRVAVSNTQAALSSAFDENSVVVPKGLYFDKTHIWAFMEKDGAVKVGIDDFMQHITGPLSRVGLKPAGVKIKKGDPLLTIIQNGKHLTLYSPVSGTITASNQTLISNSSAINSSPYADGWIYLIEPANWIREIQFLSMAEQYRAWLKDEFTRLKDFFATVIMIQTPQYAHIALQDGGALKDSILTDLGPEVWEDFQTKFIDTAR